MRKIENFEGHRRYGFVVYTLLAHVSVRGLGIAYERASEQAAMNLRTSMTAELSDSGVVLNIESSRTSAQELFYSQGSQDVAESVFHVSDCHSMFRQRY